MFCKRCGKELTNDANFCPHCGEAVNEKTAFGADNHVEDDRKSKLIAALLGIFLGGWGAHNFYLGFTKRGVVQIILTVCCCGAGAIWGFIEGIMILADSIKVDAEGRPLKKDC